MNNINKLIEGISTLCNHTQLSFRFRLSGWPAASSIIGCVATASLAAVGIVYIKSKKSKSEEKGLDTSKSSGPILKDNSNI